MYRTLFNGYIVIGTSVGATAPFLVLAAVVLTSLLTRMAAFTPFVTTGVSTVFFGTVIN